MEEYSFRWVWIREYGVLLIRTYQLFVDNKCKLLFRAMPEPTQQKWFSILLTFLSARLNLSVLLRKESLLAGPQRLISPIKDCPNQFQCENMISARYLNYFDSLNLTFHRSKCRALHQFSISRLKRMLTNEKSKNGKFH